MNYCTDEQCKGHLGKFDNCHAEALYTYTLDDNDGTTGDTDWIGHFTLAIFETDEAEQVDGRLVTIEPGNYIIETATSGAVTVYEYDTADKAREVFAGYEARYSEYLGEDDE